MKKEKIILVGGGGHAKVVVDILEKMDKYDIIGVTVNEKSSPNNFCGYPILGNDDVLPDLFNNGVTHAALGIGGFKDNELRKRVYAKIKAIGFKFVSAVHPTAVIAKSVSIGEGTVIFPGVIINTYAHIGSNVIVATGSTIDHETIIKDNVLISAGVTIGAYVSIQESALIALGAKIISGINIGKGSRVAAGAVVIRDVEENITVFGIPASPKS